MNFKAEENEILKYVITLMIDRTTLSALNSLKLDKDLKTLLKMLTLPSDTISTRDWLNLCSKRLLG